MYYVEGTPCESKRTQIEEEEKREAVNCYGLWEETIKYKGSIPSHILKLLPDAFVLLYYLQL